MTHVCYDKCRTDRYAGCRTASINAYRTCRYCDGWKRCCRCARAFLTEAIKSPCCTDILRSGAHKPWKRPTEMPKFPESTVEA